MMNEYTKLTTLYIIINNERVTTIQATFSYFLLSHRKKIELLLESFQAWRSHLENVRASDSLHVDHGNPLITDSTSRERVFPFYLRPKNSY